MSSATLIIVSLVCIAIIFYFLYLFLAPTKKTWPTKETRICPRCQRSDYRMIAASNSGVGLILGISNPHYVCNQCGFKGLFPIIVPEKKTRQKQQKKKSS